MWSRSFKGHILTLLRGKRSFSYYVGKGTQKCNLIDMSREEPRMFCFTQGLGVFFTAFLSPLLQISN